MANLSKDSKGQKRLLNFQGTYGNDGGDVGKSDGLRPIISTPDPVDSFPSLQHPSIHPSTSMDLLHTSSIKIEL